MKKFKYGPVALISFMFFVGFSLFVNSFAISTGFFLYFFDNWKQGNAKSPKD